MVTREAAEAIADVTEHRRISVRLHSTAVE